MISHLGSQKYKLSRKALETLYKSFILPIFDYADVIWDNCSEAESNSLENLHLDALRTITGTVRGTSHEKLYKESGFCSLKERRKRHKIIFYFKLVHGLCPSYLNDLLPKLVSEVNPYHHRRPQERVVPQHHTEIYRKSFFPATTQLWNTLPVNIQNSTSLSHLKRFLLSEDCVVPPQYYIGNRTEQIIHCKLRLGMSDLNLDMFNRHLTETSRALVVITRKVHGTFFSIAQSILMQDMCLFKIFHLTTCLLKTCYLEIQP